MFFIIYGILILIGAGALLFIKKQKDAEATGINSKKGSTSDFMNIHNIVNHVLYNKNKEMFCYIRVDPVNIDLMSERDLETLNMALTAEFSGLDHSFRFLMEGKQEDIKPLVAKYGRRLQSVEDPQIRELCRNEIRELEEGVRNAALPARCFYFLIDMPEGSKEELTKRARSFCSKLSNCNLSAKIVGQTEIVEMLERISNPQYCVAEDLLPELNITTIIDLNEVK